MGQITKKIFVFNLKKKKKNALKSEMKCASLFQNKNRGIEDMKFPGQGY